MFFQFGESCRTERAQGSPVATYRAWPRVALIRRRGLLIKSTAMTHFEVSPNVTRHARGAGPARVRRECTVNVLGRPAQTRRHAHYGRPEQRVLGRSEKCAASDIAAQGQREMRRVVGGGRGHASPKRHTRRAGHAPTRGTPGQVTPPPTQLAHRRAGRSSESECAGVAYEAPSGRCRCGARGASERVSGCI